jgi:hypothetical protein
MRRKFACFDDQTAKPELASSDKSQLVEREFTSLAVARLFS